MARLIVYQLIALNVVLLAWGQMTFPPDIPTFPPPPTSTAVINESVVVFVGEPVIVGQDVRVTIDCSLVIDGVINTGVSDPVINWYKDGREIMNGSELNVVLSTDRSLCIITDTLMAVGGQLGTDGNYSCEVCTDSSLANCMTNFTDAGLCDPPNLMLAVGGPVVFPGFIALTCGQDATVQALAGATVSLSCSILNGSDPFTTEIYKDSVLVSSSFSLDLAPASDDDFGTYTFRVLNNCGQDISVTRILLQGVPPDIDEGPFIDCPDNLPPGDVTVKIGSPVYVVEGSDVIINCDILTGTPPIFIIWLRNGVLDSSLGSANSITIDDYMEGDTFTCRADNAIGFDNETSIISVFEPPQILPIPIPTAPPGGTTVSTGMPAVTPITTGSSVTIYCPSSGIDTPTIVWFKDGTMVTSGGRFTISTTMLGTEPITSVLMIDNFQAGDEGTYSCSSTNRAGTANGETELTVLIVGTTRWKRGPWTKCSRTCETGHQKRVVCCVEGDEVVPDNRCNENIRPISERNCNGHIRCFPCQDLHPRFCRRLMRTPMGCMGDYARKICCWSCSND